MPRVPGGSQGAARFPISEVPLSFKLNSMLDRITEARLKMKSMVEKLKECPADHF